MRTETQKIARFGLLTALTLVLGLLDRAVPLTAILGGVAPGIKLGLANTVLLYGVYLMDWPACVLLMVTKVILSGFIFGSLTAILYSLSGGVLSLAVMLLLRKKPEAGALTAAIASAAAFVYLLIRYRNPAGQTKCCRNAGHAIPFVLDYLIGMSVNHINRDFGKRRRSFYCILYHFI